MATAPLRDAVGLPAVVGYLRGDFLSAFLIGAAFTWLVFLGEQMWDEFAILTGRDRADALA